MLYKNRLRSKKKDFFVYVIIPGFFLYGCILAIISMLFIHFFDDIYGSLNEVFFDLIARWTWFGITGVIIMYIIWRSNKRRSMKNY